MCSSNGAHRGRRWVIIEKNAAPAVDLQVDESRRKQCRWRHDFDWPVIRALVERGDAMDQSPINQEDRVIVPLVSIEDTAGRNCQPGPCRAFGWFQTHPLTSSQDQLIAPIDVWPRYTTRRPIACMLSWERNSATAPEVATMTLRHRLRFLRVNE